MRGRTMRFTMSSHGPPLVRGAASGAPLVQAQWRRRGAGDVFQLFGHIFAEAAQLAAALGASRVCRGQFDLDARDVIRNWLALRLVGGCVIGQVPLC